MKMFPKHLFSSIVLICISLEATKCDQICDSLVPDAITDLQNGSIVVFRDKDVFLFDRQEKQLVGPTPINQLFKDMSGPIDAAVTFESHESVTEFVGTSLYFGQGMFYTFKNLRPYQVEWGALVYLPVNGKQDTMGSQSEEGKRLMSQTLSAAYFDPITSRTKFIFSDKSVLGFNFELGSEYDIPEVSTLESEFKKFGVTELPKNISAALTLKDVKRYEVVLFEGSHYCQIEINVKKTDQKCDLKPISEFFGCKNLSPIKSMSSPPNGIFARLPGGDNPITVETEVNQPLKVTTPSVVKQTVETRKDRESDAEIKTKKPSASNRLLATFLTQMIPILLFLIFIQ